MVILYLKRPTDTLKAPCSRAGAVIDQPVLPVRGSSPWRNGPAPVALSHGQDQLLGAARHCCSPSLCGVQPLGSLLQCWIVVWKPKTTKLRGGAAMGRCWLPPPCTPSPCPPARAAAGGCRQPRARLAVPGEMDRAELCC